MIFFLELPRDRIMPWTKEKFYRSMDFVVQSVTSLVERNANFVKAQQDHNQPGLSQSRMNPVQQSDNVNPHFRPLNLATAGPSDISSPTSPTALRDIGFLRSEADLVRKNLLQIRQHSENHKQEFQSSWIQQNQKSTENIQAMNRTRMSLEYHLNSKFSPQTHQASQNFQIAERGQNPCASFYGRASPTPPSATVGHGKNSSNVSHRSSLNFQYPDQACNSLKLLNIKTEIQVQSHEISSSTMTTSRRAEITSPENNWQFSTATQPPNPLLRAVSLYMSWTRISNEMHISNTSSNIILLILPWILA